MNSLRNWKVLLLVVGIVSLWFLVTLLPMGVDEPGGNRSSPSALAAGEVQTFESAGISLDYPTTWMRYDFGFDTTFVTRLGYLATVEIPGGCAPSPANTCNLRTWQLEPNTLVMIIERNRAPGSAIPSESPASGRLLEVGGEPALYREHVGSSPDVDLELEWNIRVPGTADEFYLIWVEIRGPDVESLRRQIAEVVDSVEFAR